MTPICPEGHASNTSDYCEQCGRPIAVRPPQPTEVLPVVEEADTSTSTSAADHEKQCPRCHTTSPRDDKFCENCGHEFAAAAQIDVRPPSGDEPGREVDRERPSWQLVVRVDLDWFRRSHSEGVSAPATRADRTYPLAARHLQIGRSNGTTAEAGPEIALDDPGISRKHAVLERQADGSYAVRDLGSTNGTFINDEPNRVSRDEAVPLADDDEIRIGAWTTMTVRAV